jgi:hypothetical protein
MSKPVDQIYTRQDVRDVLRAVGSIFTIRFAKNYFDPVTSGILHLLQASYISRG